MIRGSGRSGGDDREPSGSANHNRERGRLRVDCGSDGEWSDGESSSGAGGGAREVGYNDVVGAGFRRSDAAKAKCGGGCAGITEDRNAILAPLIRGRGCAGGDDVKRGRLANGRGARGRQSCDYWRDGEGINGERGAGAGDRAGGIGDNDIISARVVRRNAGEREGRGGRGGVVGECDASLAPLIRGLGCAGGDNAECRSLTGGDDLRRRL